ncbi:MAG: hypothetical protein L6R38_002488 [Xanthoria sp. 2 TBL-2021]|nr:MAG: hypothetical protein L6R38_002488 [Xanthoria sp. 2 TBL-2021]
MAPVGPPNGPDPPAEEMDDMFDYTVDMQDVFRDVDVNMDAPSESQAAQLKPKDGGDVLGLDEEVKVTRKRQPVAKLDEDRLLSQAGIPKLQRIAKERFHFKGKGHEYRDLARLLNIYQLWLDDLYPRAKFADGLAMIEKLGHKKRIQIMRREWIHEGKPREKYNETDATKEAEGTVQPESDPKHRDATGDNTNIIETIGRQHMSDPSNEDLFRGVPHGNAKSAIDETETLFLPNDPTDDQPPEDDLDALLAETADDNEGRSFIIPSPPRRQEPHAGDDFDDEEALAAMGYD